MTTTASICSHNCICVPRTPEETRVKDPINLYFQHRFEENKEKKLAELKKKHEAGEISDFQYNVEKFLVKNSQFQPMQTVVYMNEMA